MDATHSPPPGVPGASAARRYELRGTDLQGRSTWLLRTDDLAEARREYRAEDRQDWRDLEIWDRELDCAVSPRSPVEEQALTLCIAEYGTCPFGCAKDGAPNCGVHVRAGECEPGRQALEALS